MKLNCDLGEGFAAWQKGDDKAIMPFIDMANIACGFHAGDALIMSQTITLALKHNVSIGAHPSYQDLHGFGRRSIAYTSDELTALIQYQVSALQGLCSSQNTTISYIKPHGALYNDMMKDDTIFTTVCHAISTLKISQGQALPLMIQALPSDTLSTSFSDNTLTRKITIAGQYNVPLLFEAFADRNYEDNGLLTPRSKANAVLSNIDEIRQRAQQLLEQQCITSVNGTKIPMKVDTLCIHGDHPNAVNIATALRKILS